MRFTFVLCLAAIFTSNCQSEGIRFTGTHPLRTLFESPDKLCAIDSHENLGGLSDAIRDLTDFADHLNTHSKTPERRITGIGDIKRAGGTSLYHELCLSPRFETHETKEVFIVFGTMPGLRKEDISMSVTEMSGAKVIELIGQSPNATSSRDPPPSKMGDMNGTLITADSVLHAAYAKFERHIRIPSNADPTTLKASYQNGLLIITMMPKCKQDQQRHKIVIE
jgi:HSP20 family molecular chaperone IbpA